jgi:hypothetical protein
VGLGVDEIVALVHERDRLLARIAEIDSDLSHAVAASGESRKQCGMAEDSSPPAPRRRGAPFHGGSVVAMPGGKFRWRFTFNGREFYGPLVSDRGIAEAQRIDAAAAAQRGDAPARTRFRNSSPLVNHYGACQPDPSLSTSDPAGATHEDDEDELEASTAAAQPKDRTAVIQAANDGSADDADATGIAPDIARDCGRRMTLDGRTHRREVAAKRLQPLESLSMESSEYPEAKRPRTRGECPKENGPCPFVSCSHHLYLDVNPETGAIKLNFPHLEAWEMAETCSLDVADRGGLSVEDMAAAMNLSEASIRNTESDALRSMKEFGGDGLGLMPERGE